jgi:hypothetical protein
MTKMEADELGTLFVRLWGYALMLYGIHDLFGWDWVFIVTGFIAWTPKKWMV